MKCPYDGLEMEFLASANDDVDGPGYWCPMCEKSFDEDDKELAREMRLDLEGHAKRFGLDDEAAKKSAKIVMGRK